MKDKKGEISVVVYVLVAVMAGLFILYISATVTKTTGGGIVTTLKDWIGIESEDDAAQEEIPQEEIRINRELILQAESVYNNFESGIKNCINIKNSNPCNCITMDFTDINTFVMKVSDDKGKKTLELLDENRLPIGKKSELGTLNIYLVEYPLDPDIGNRRKNMQSFYKQPDYTTLYSLESDPPYISFSKDSIQFPFYRSIIHEMGKNKMNKINFIKISKGARIKNMGDILPLDAIFIDEEDYGVEKCQ